MNDAAMTSVIEARLGKAPRVHESRARSSDETLDPVPLWLQSPIAAAAQPITAGVPFPIGTLRDTGQLTLVDPSGASVPLQATPIGWWPDGSVQWLLLDFVARNVTAGKSGWTLQPTDEWPRVAAPPRMQVDEFDDGLSVMTGATTFLMRRRWMPLPACAICDGEDLLDARRTRTVIRDKNGNGVPLIMDRASIEETGPVRTTVRMEIRLERVRSCRMVARCSYFAGTGLLRLQLTIHNPNAARHPGGLWDLGDARSFLFRELALELGICCDEDRQVWWTTGAGRPSASQQAGSLEIYQDSSGGENWQSRNHVTANGQVPCSFRGFRVRTPAQERHGLRASPVVAVQTEKGIVTAAVPEFWQQFPKAIDVADDSIRLGVFPRQWPEVFELQGGEQKTHTLWFHFASRNNTDYSALDWVHQPARLAHEPEWLAKSDVIPEISLHSLELEGPLEEYVNAISIGAPNLLARREIVDEYGWRNFGEIYADHEQAFCSTAKPVISHYNNQYDCLNGLLTHYFRTGESTWLNLADPLARHVIDIDIYHTERDKAAYNGGLFWHTDHYRDAGTATHRAYSVANRVKGKAYGGGPSNEHNYTTGLLHYFYLTGDPNARDAVISLADWVIHMDDGRRNLLRLVFDGPTGLASSTAETSYHGPGRGAGNSINALLDGWLLTGNRNYLNKAESLVKRCIHPADDIDAYDLLHVETRWSYTVFLKVLIRYLELKLTADEVDESFAYARASLLHYAEWMAAHEKPYFDQREKLEFPTETWAAQDLRKANVMRLAARYAPEPLQRNLLDRGEALADRAWRDLQQFESRFVTRAAAIIMLEGLRDLQLRRSHTVPAPAPGTQRNLGKPAHFVPQKRVVKSRLTSPIGLVRTAMGLLDIRRWHRPRRSTNTGRR